MTPRFQPFVPLQDAPRNPFPLECLPPVLRDYCAAVSESLQVPPDLPGSFALTTVSAAIAGCVHVQLNADWREPTNLFSVVVLPPGERKSPVVRRLVSPLQQLEISEREAFTPTVGDSDETPFLPRRLVEDVTPEKLTNLLSLHDGRLALLSDEGGPLEIFAGRYSNSGAPQLEVLLKAYSGDQIIVDRIMRTSDRVPTPALVVGLTVQPDVIRALLGKPIMRSRGLLSRFLWATPAPMVGSRRIDSAPIPPDLEEAYTRLLLTLGQRFPAYGIGDGVTQTLTLSQDARSEFSTFRATLEFEMQHGESLEHLRDFGSKMPGNVARIAAVIHSCTTPDSNILDVNVMKQAAALGYFYLDQARLLVNAPSVHNTRTNAQFVASYVARHGRRIWSLRDLHHVLRSANSVFRMATTLRNALSLLETSGYLVVQPVSASGPGRPSEHIYCNPEWTHRWPFIEDLNAQNSEGRNNHGFLRIFRI